MVVLNRIYTRTGDGGATRLANGAQVAKTDLRVEAYGAVDETNACLGLARLHTTATAPNKGFSIFKKLDIFFDELSETNIHALFISFSDHN